jgi:aromatic-L-amino-acid decarboxylase
MFMAYFPSVATGPGILGEWLSSALNSNVMLWRNAPSSTELEEVVVSWLRQMLGLPEAFDGMFTDTASISSLLSIVAARHAVPGLGARDEGLAGRAGLGRLRMYLSSEAHSSIEKAAIVAGIGRAGVRRIPVDAEYRMEPDALAAAILEDRAAGWTPFCVVATLGTTSSTSVDPCEAIAAICRREALWLHVDAAYAGAAAIVPEMRPLLAGWEHADSIVVNPHKWLFVPVDLSAFFCRRMDVVRQTFSLVPEYLRTPDSERDARNLMDTGIQMGRRFRALKLWMVLRSFGAAGIRDVLTRHIALAQRFGGWIDAHPDFERLAPVPFSVVCFRARPRHVPEHELDRFNERLVDAVNASGEVFLSHTRLGGALVLRLAIGHLRTTETHVARAWTLLQAHTAAL